MNGVDALQAAPGAPHAQYELLRASALGAATTPQDRRGLTLLLRQGMWSWARAIARERAPHEAIAPFAPQPSRSDLACDRHAVINLLAAMAMTLSDRRTA